MRFRFLSEHVYFYHSDAARLGVVVKIFWSIGCGWRAFIWKQPCSSWPCFSFSHFAFVTTGFGGASAGVAVSLVPLLLWSALRFGSIGTSVPTVLIVASLSFGGGVRGRGPFLR